MDKRREEVSSNYAIPKLFYARQDGAVTFALLVATMTVRIMSTVSQNNLNELSVVNSMQGMRNIYG